MAKTFAKFRRQIAVEVTGAWSSSSSSSSSRRTFGAAAASTSIGNPLAAAGAREKIVVGVEQAKTFKKFREFWPELLSDILKDGQWGRMTSAVGRLEQVFKRNVPQGKQNRAMALITLYSELVAKTETAARSSSRDEEQMRICFIIAWCIEIGHAAGLMSDDIMDESETRRGALCWYKEPSVGLTAVNDAFMMENLMYFIKYKYVSGQPYFQALLQQTHSNAMTAVMGQGMDTQFAKDFSLDLCTWETYEGIVMNKTSLYSFYNPFATAMILASIKDPFLFDAVKTLSIHMGYLFQVQDDYLDCFGNPEVTGKIGTDIVDRKCTWLLLRALQEATPLQRKVIEQSYGKKSAADELAIKQVYAQIGIAELYASFEEESYHKIQKIISNLPPALPKSPFFQLLDGIYKRDK